MQEKLNALMQDEAFLEKLFNTEEPKDVQKLFSENGVELSIEEVKALGEAIEKVDAEGGELSEDDLDQVAGGVAATTVLTVLTTTYKIYRHRERIRRFFRRW